MWICAFLKIKRSCDYNAQQRELIHDTPLCLSTESSKAFPMLSTAFILNFPQWWDSCTDCVHHFVSQRSHLHICSPQDRKQWLAGGSNICHHWCHWHRLVWSHKSWLLWRGHICNGSTINQDVHSWDEFYCSLGAAFLCCSCTWVRFPQSCGCRKIMCK